jgi:CBS domain-containing protein
MKALDIMNSDVITVRLNQSVSEVAEILLTKRISGVPVLDAAGDLVGMVSEGDLMRRAEFSTGHHRSWWLRLLMGREGLAQEFVKETARKVADVMSKRVITAPPEASLGELADLLERNCIKRVPIVKNHKVVGIVSRANLLQALASLRKQIDVEKPVGDARLREALLSRLKTEPWARTAMLNVTVHDGIVDLWGIVDSQTEKQAIRVAAEVVPGVQAVNDGLVVRPLADTA